MAGNVWESTLSEHESGGKVVRGGSWRNEVVFFGSCQDYSFDRLINFFFFCEYGLQFHKTHPPLPSGFRIRWDVDELIGLSL